MSWLRTHITDLCEHDVKDATGVSVWCAHCEHGCTTCGDLEGINDHGYCEGCAADRMAMAIDSACDAIRHGEGA